MGVQRQYTGTSGQIDNCQLGVFLVYATPKSYAFIDRELYLPKPWIESPQRCQQAHVPDATRFMTKPQLAHQMLEQAFNAGVTAQWITTDEFYARDHHLRRWLEERRQAYVVAIPCNERVRVDALECRVDELAASWTEEEWTRLSDDSDFGVSRQLSALRSQSIITVATTLIETRNHIEQAISSCYE